MRLDRHEDGTTRRVTIWAAWASALATLAFLLALLATPFMAPLPLEWRGAAAYAAVFEPWTMLAVVISLLLVGPVLVLLAGLHQLTAPALRWASTIGLVFGASYAAIIAANDYVQLTTVRASLLAGQLDGLDPLIWVNPNGVFGALETLGYLFQAIALAVLIPLFRSGRYARTIRWLLGANLALGALTIVGQLAELYFLLFPGLLAWSLLFGPATVLIALHLRSEAGRTAHPASGASTH